MILSCEGKKHGPTQRVVSKSKISAEQYEQMINIPVSKKIKLCEYIKKQSSVFPVFDYDVSEELEKKLVPYNQFIDRNGLLGVNSDDEFIDIVNVFVKSRLIDQFLIDQDQIESWTETINSIDRNDYEKAFSDINLSKKLFWLSTTCFTQILAANNSEAINSRFSQLFNLNGQIKQEIENRFSGIKSNFQSYIVAFDYEFFKKLRHWYDYTLDDKKRLILLKNNYLEHKQNTIKYLIYFNEKKKIDNIAERYYQDYVEVDKRFKSIENNIGKTLLHPANWYLRDKTIKFFISISRTLIHGAFYGF